jgi:hypothetical protein
MTSMSEIPGHYHLREPFLIVQPVLLFIVIGTTNRAASTSALVQRVSAEQAVVEARLLELEGMENIQARLRHTNISEEDDMNVDEPEHPISRAIDAKRRVLSKYVRLIAIDLEILC